MAAIAQSLTVSKSSSLVSAPIVFAGRLLFSLIFLTAAVNHFSSQTIAYAASQGVPLASIGVPFSGVLALLGSLSILLGYRARIGGWLIALFLVAVTPLHKFWGIADPMTHQIQMVMFMKNVSMLGASLLITQFGSGPWSIDKRN